MTQGLLCRSQPVNSMTIGRVGPCSRVPTGTACRGRWGRGRSARSDFLIRDRDSAYTRSFDEVFTTEGAKLILIPIRSPKANAFAERWVRTVRAELLDWALARGPRHLDRLLDTYVSHYNSHRPHRGLDLAAPDSPTPDAPQSALGMIRCRDVLGGFIYEYHARAA